MMMEGERLELEAKHKAELQKGGARKGYPRDANADAKAYVDTYINPILFPLVEKAIIDRPKDVAQFFIDALIQVQNRKGKENISVAPAVRRKEEGDEVLEAAKDGFVLPEDGIEADSAKSEDITDVAAILFPDGKNLPTNTPKFSLAFSQANFDGWVRQKSPCCGAASVAGCWNAIMGWKRNDEQALNAHSVLRIYCDSFRVKATKKQGSIERLLAHPVDDIIEEVKAELAKENVIFGESKKKGGATPLKCIRTMKALALEEVEGEEGVVSSEEKAGSVSGEAEGGEKEEGGEDVEEKNYVRVSPSWSALRQLYLENTTAEEVEVEEEEEDEDAPPPLEGEKDAAEDKVEEAASTLMVFDFSAKPSKKRKKSKSGWNYKGDFKVLFKQLIALAKLSKERPSTAPIGNAGILMALRKLNEDSDADVNVKSKKFMGKKSAKAEIGLTKSDSEAKIATQWAALRTAFCKKDSCLIFHLKNHYALIYATREWVREDGSVVREVYTARKGQRPTSWIDFTEMRSTMIGWAGYGIMMATRVQ